MSDAPPVEARGLVKRYGEIVAVDHVDLTVERGDVFGYLGPNGAGKTTSLRMLLGLIRPDRRARRASSAATRSSTARRRSRASPASSKGPRFYPYLSGRRNLRLLADYDEPRLAARIDEVLELVELRDRAKDRVGGYSHGMRQRLGIAASLLRGSRGCCCSTSRRPASTRRACATCATSFARLAGEGITILLSSHLLYEVEELCNRVAIIRKGSIVYQGELERPARDGGERLPAPRRRARAGARRAARPAGRRRRRVARRRPPLHRRRGRRRGAARSRSARPASRSRRSRPRRRASRSSSSA